MIRAAEILRPIAAGGLAGLLWGLAALLVVADLSPLGRARPLVATLAPGGLDRLALAEGPWKVAALVGSALVVALVVAAATMLVARIRTGAGVRFIVLWAAVVPASILGSAALLVGGMLDHQTDSTLWMQTATEVASGLSRQSWAVAAGWLPALLVLRAPPADHAGPSARARLGAAVVALVGIVIAGGVGGASAEASAELRARIEAEQAEADERQREDVDDVAPLDPASVLPPVPGFPESFTDCPGLEVRLGGGDAAMGRSQTAVVALNPGGRACTLVGYPGVGVEDRSGAPLDGAIAPGAVWAVEDAGPVALVLEPGAIATARLTWRSDQLDGSDDEARSILLAPTSAGGDAVRLPFEVTLREGSELFVTAWTIDAGTGVDG
jgi:hypothetical protein